MALTPGTKLGAYEIQSPLGAGGMGEVYRAHDERLGRDVAIKVLPDAFAQDPERLARFEREAKSLASLNHPNIAAIYGLEQSNGVRFLVLEFVPGKTLTGQLAAGAPPVEEALGICRQIAEALEAAHDRGIVHRDLKPENVKITPEGKVKVLDFGLAKTLATAAVASESSISMNVTVDATSPGVILGTPAYMSPEQARGRPIDKRTDIWAFGCVLYESLTGTRAFAAETSSDTMAMILNGDPEWQALPQATPANITVLIHRCLQKDLARRLRDIGDARLEIEEALSGAAAERPEASNSAVRRAPGRGVSWAVAAIMTLIAALALWGPARQRTAQPLARFSVTLPANQILSVRVGTSISLSPDGKQLVYVGSRGGRTQLYLRPMDRLEATPIPGTEGAEGPFFSPDGQWIGFAADHKLKKVAIRGGTPLALCSAPVSLGASWGPRDKIIFTPSPDAGLLQVSAAGGIPEVLTVSDSNHGESGHYWPEVLPGGEAVLYTVVTSTGSAHIAVLRLDTGKSQTIIEAGTNPHYASPGYLVFARGATLLAAPFDLAGLRVTGPAVPVLQGVLSTIFAGAQFSFSRDGSLVYLPGGLQALDRTLLWVDRKGMGKPLGAPSHPYMDPRVSPDGREVAVTIHDGTKEDVWVYELARGTLTRLTLEGFENETPLWTPRGDKVMVSSSRVGPPMSVFSRPKDGSGSEERLFSSQHHVHLNSISPDGQLLAFTDYHPISGGDIWLAELAGQHNLRPLLQSAFNEWGAVFSPNGRWLAYVSNESGRDEIYVQSFPKLDRKWQISNEGGTEPMWARSGRELFYRDADKMMAVAVTTEPAFSPGKPAQLFEGRYEKGLTLGHTNYDVSPDAQRFLMLKAGEQEAAPTQVNVVLNWFEDLKPRDSSGKE